MELDDEGLQSQAMTSNGIVLSDEYPFLLPIIVTYEHKLFLIR